MHQTLIWGLSNAENGFTFAKVGLALLPVRVTHVEGKSVGRIFDGIAIEIDLKFVHAFRMAARHRNWAEDGVAEIDREYGACFAAEYVEVRDVEAYVLPAIGESVRYLQPAHDHAKAITRLSARGSKLILQSAQPPGDGLPRSPCLAGRGHTGN